MSTLAGKISVVTGSTSGIGRGIAEHFARLGSNILVHGRDRDDGLETVRRVKAAGCDAEYFDGDLTDAAVCRGLIRRAVERFGGLDILVNNAAFQQHTKSLEDLTEAHLQETLQTNIGGYFHMARAALPHLPRGGCIINTGSETALFGSKHLLDYSATKGAIHAFTKSLAGNLLERGIRVNTVVPGSIESEQTAALPEEKKRMIREGNPMKRIGTVDEVARLTAWLVSDQAPFITGASFVIDGGQLARI